MHYNSSHKYCLNHSLSALVISFANDSYLWSLFVSYEAFSSLLWITMLTEVCTSSCWLLSLYQTWVAYVPILEESELITSFGLQTEFACVLGTLIRIKGCLVHLLIFKWKNYSSSCCLLMGSDKIKAFVPWCLVHNLENFLLQTKFIMHFLLVFH